MLQVFCWTSTASVDGAVPMASVASVIEQRCSSCHASTPTQAGFQAAPKGIVFDTNEDIVRHAVAINQQSVLTNAMPMGNLTQMTDAERELLGQWFRQLSTD